MTQWLAILLLWWAWGHATIGPSAERVLVIAEQVDGVQIEGELTVSYSPDPIALRIDGGILQIEADWRGVWAAHRDDPSTIALLSAEPFTTLTDLQAILPPMSLPTASFAQASHQRVWSPSPFAGPVRWASIRPLTHAPFHWPIGVRLVGEGQGVHVSVEFRGSRLRVIEIHRSEPIAQPASVSQITVLVEPLPVAPQLPLPREGFVVHRLGALAPLGPPLRVGSRVPHDLDLFSPASAMAFDEWPWDPAARFQLLVLVRDGPIDERAEMLRTLNDSIKAAQDQLARSAADSGLPVVQFTPIIAFDSGGARDPRQRTSEVRSLIGSEWIYTMMEQRRLIERIAPGARAAGLLIDRQRRIRAILPVDTAEDFAQRLVEQALSESPRGR